MPFKDRNKSETHMRRLNRKEIKNALEDVAFEQSG